MELNTILNIMSECGLTADELLLVWLTLYARDEESHNEFFCRWFNDCGGQKQLKDLFNSLKEKGVIKKDYNPESYIPNNIEFSQRFLNKYYKQSGKLGSELFSEYEPFVFINGKNFSLKNITRKFCTLEEFFFFYSSQIGHNPDKHREILELLRWGKENKLITYGILEFVSSHKWLELKKMKEEGYIKSTEMSASSSIYLD